MNLRNKYAVHTVRTLFALLMLFSGISGLLMTEMPEGTTESMLNMMAMLQESGLFYMIKGAEVIGGAMLLFNFLPALAAVALAPLAVGIIIVNANLSPEFLFMGVIVAAFEAYLGYVYWDKYKAMFQR